MSQATTSFINMLLRGITLASKFLLIIFLARYLPAEQIGLYGLVAATVSLATYPLGFDFYTYSTRDLLKSERTEWGQRLKSQSALYLILYATILPSLLLIFVLGLLPWTVAKWFFVILILEHATQEMVRLLVAASRQLSASAILFFRSGLWALVVSVLMAYDREFRELNVVLAAWAAGGLIALAIGTASIALLGIGGWRNAIDWNWLRRGFRVAIPFLLATLALRALFTIDRYWFENLHGLEVLAAYVLFMGIANALLSVMDAGVFTFLYPALISSHHHGNIREFRKVLGTMIVRTVVLGVVFSLTALLAIGPLLGILDNTLYLDHEELFPWILAAIMAYILSLVPHYGLYAQDFDRPIIISHICMLSLFVPVVWWLSFWNPLLAVPQGLCAVFVLLLFWKTWVLFRLTPGLCAI